MTKMKSRLVGNLLILSFTILISFTSCKPNLEFKDTNLISGNASPILLTPDETEINLEDYVLDVSKIDSINGPKELILKREGNILKIYGTLEKWISDINLWSEQQAYSIPLKKTTKSKVVITYTGNAKSVKIKGEFNAWNPTELIQTENGHQIEFLLNPGNYQYVFVLDGKEKRDLSNPDSISNGMGNYNSVIKLPRADKTKLPLLSTEKFTNNEIILSTLNQPEEVRVYWKNFFLNDEFVTISGKTIKIKIPNQAQNNKRSFIRAWASTSDGISNEVLIPLDFGKVLTNPNQLVRQDKEAQILYFLMVDRFNNGNKENDEPVSDPSIHPKANYYGGDIAGITQKIKDGYFAKLGINTLWLSPITQNPKGAFGKYLTPPTTFSGYHGYWPVSLQQIDYRFGKKQELEELIRLAHEQNINVILDYVAHHIHQEHPLFKLKPEWFTSLYLPDGSLNTERWDDHRLTTWFDTFMPTFDLSRPEVVGPMTDTAMYWVEQYDLDGFRHDASKHIDLLFWRELTKKVKSKIKRPVYQIGETYGSRELVNSYVNSGMLDAQFDFNVYDDAVGTFANDETPFSRVANSITESIEWFGDHNLMGYISGNQDRARFISYADGSIRFDEDAKKAGWTREINIKDTLGYKKLQSLHAFNMTIPGVPVIYYADEIGDAGGNDPDNRRMMRFLELNEFENKTLETTTKLVNLRRNNLSLIYGDFQIVKVTDTEFVYKRKYFSNEVIVAFNKAPNATTINLGTLSRNSKTIFNSQVQLQNQETIVTLPPYSFEIITIDLN